MALPDGEPAFNFESASFFALPYAVINARWPSFASKERIRVPDYSVKNL
jgi:hypothetical protein